MPEPTSENPEPTLEKIVERVGKMVSPLGMTFFKGESQGDGMKHDYTWVESDYSAQKARADFFRFANLVLVFGEAPLDQAGISYGTRLGKLTLVQPSEVRDIHRAREEIINYLDDDKRNKPLNICLLAPPGGGKSTIVNSLRNSITEHTNPKKKRLELLVFNASQYETFDHFREVWNKVRLESNKGPVMVFIDEFDVGHCKWVGHFLAPTNDGATFEPEEHRFGSKIVFIFGGGVFESSMKMKANMDRYDKLRDFVRRMDVFIDLGPAAFRWEHPQRGKHPSLSPPTFEEELNTVRVMVDFDGGKIIFRQGNVDEYWHEYRKYMTVRPVGKLKEIALGKGGLIRSSISDSVPVTSDQQYYLDKEIFFALVKRALVLRHLIQSEHKRDDPAQSMLFSVCEGWKDWRKCVRKEFSAFWKDVWIDRPVAHLLMHPAMRLHAGLGSLQKFVMRFNLAGAERFTLGRLPSYESTKHLVDFGGPEVADIVGNAVSLGNTWYIKAGNSVKGTGIPVNLWLAERIKALSNLDKEIDDVWPLINDSPSRTKSSGDSGSKTAGGGGHGGDDNGRAEGSKGNSAGNGNEGGRKDSRRDEAEGKQVEEQTS